MSRAAVCALLGALTFTATVAAAGAKSAPRPNIVLIMADDMGFSDLGCYGSEIATPNLDRLAAGGLRFTQFYNTSRCCPTRASLLTGLYPHQAGMGGMVDKRCMRPAGPYMGYLNDRCVTIAEVLKPAGYHVLMSGKWHVGECQPHWPTDRGFDRYFGLISGASNYFRLDPGRKMAMDDKPYDPEGEKFYMTDAFTDYAIRFLDGTKGTGRPFFLYLAFTCPHWPLHAWPEDIAKYRAKYMGGWEALRKTRHKRMIQLGLVDPTWRLSPLDAPPWDAVEDKEGANLKMAVYAAQIDRMDQNIGRLLAKLKELGVQNNTLILFLADNGGCHEEIRRGDKSVPPGPKEGFHSYGRNWANASNTPFRRYKHWVHEGGIATPLIAWWPDVIKHPGAITSQVGHVIDLMTTCADVAGGEYPATRNGRNIVPLEGKSLLPIFRGHQREPHEALYWEHEGNRAVRQGKWKLVAVKGGPWELYDVETDRTELNDLSRRNPEKAAELAALYDRWAQKCLLNRPPPTILVRTVKPESLPAATAVAYGVTRVDFERLAANIIGLRRMIPVRESTKGVKYRNRSREVPLVGTMPEYPGAHAVKVVRGRFLLHRDTHDRANVAAIGREVARALFPDEDPLGRSVRIDDIDLQVVGIVREGDPPSKGRKADPPRGADLKVFIPLTTLWARLGETEVTHRDGRQYAEQFELSRIEITVENPARIAEVAKEVRRILKAYHKQADYSVEIVP